MSSKLPGFSEDHQILGASLVRNGGKLLEAIFWTTILTGRH